MNAQAKFKTAYGFVRANRAAAEKLQAQNEGYDSYMPTEDAFRALGCNSPVLHVAINAAYGPVYIGFKPDFRPAHVRLAEIRNEPCFD